MTEDKRAAGSTDAVHVEHWCQAPGCKRWGCFGYDKGKGQSDWWCGDHRPDRMPGY
ncbi:hypothetical protein [Xaviernesmea rhizosphaerae]|uniref:hypothetical protein n=1 Tax=Xaviernesmea rhizosphaerae TaxID=1672749 RepID=UPI003CCA4908